jgi:hypothetical protein
LRRFFAPYATIESITHEFPPTFIDMDATPEELGPATGLPQGPKRQAGDEVDHININVATRFGSKLLGFVVLSAQRVELERAAERMEKDRVSTKVDAEKLVKQHA